MIPAPHPLRCHGCENRFKAADNFVLACDHPLLTEVGMTKPFPMSEDDRLFVHFAGCPFLLRSSATTSAEQVLEELERWMGSFVHHYGHKPSGKDVLKWIQKRQEELRSQRGREPG